MIGEIEARQGQPRLVGLRSGGSRATAWVKPPLGGQEGAAAEPAPGGEIQEAGAVAAAASAAGVSATGMEGGVSASPPGRVMVIARIGDFDREIVGIGRDHQAAGGGQRREFGIVALVAAWRGRRCRE